MWCVPRRRAGSNRPAEAHYGAIEQIHNMQRGEINAHCRGVCFQITFFSLALLNLSCAHPLRSLLGALPRSLYRFRTKHPPVDAERSLERGGACTQAKLCDWSQRADQKKGGPRAVLQEIDVPSLGVCVLYLAPNSNSRTATPHRVTVRVRV